MTEEGERHLRMDLRSGRIIEDRPEPPVEERSASSPAAISRGPGGQRGGRSGIPIQSQSWSTKPTGLNHNWSSGGPSSPRQKPPLSMQSSGFRPPGSRIRPGAQPG
jgi:hypothetical protein